MNLIIDFADSSVTIKLLDNPVVNKWIKDINKVSEWRVWETNQARTLENYRGPNENRELRRKGLISAIRNFEADTGIKFPFEVTDQTEFSRQDLNKIHRYFTTATSFNTWSLNSERIIERSDSNYFIFNSRLIDINSAVHIFEGYYSTENKIAVKSNNIVTFQAKDQPTDYYSHEPGDWRYLDYDLEFDVFIEYAICGKSYFQAFIDNDDPREWDITAQFSSHANTFYIDNDNKRNDTMKGEVFKTWLKNHVAYSTAWQFMPLGKIVSGRLGDLKDFKGIRLE
jgi:hypothetical protein